MKPDRYSEMADDLFGGDCIHDPQLAFKSQCPLCLATALRQSALDALEEAAEKARRIIVGHLGIKEREVLAGTVVYSIHAHADSIRREAGEGE